MRARGSTRACATRGSAAISSACSFGSPSARRPSGSTSRTRAWSWPTPVRACRPFTLSTSSARVTGRIPSHDELEREAFERGDATLAWPAPSDATRAIDVFEHDLATLRPLAQRARSCESRGPRPIHAGAERLPRAVGARALGASSEAVVRRGWPRARDGPDPRRAQPAAARRASVFAVGAPTVQRLSVSVPPVGHLSSGATRGRQPAATPRSVDEGQPLPPNAGGIPARASRRGTPADPADGSARVP